MAESQDSLASLRMAEGRYGQAEPLYRRALGIREAQLGAEHPDVATSLEALGQLYTKQGKEEDDPKEARVSMAIITGDSFNLVETTLVSSEPSRRRCGASYRMASSSNCTPTSRRKKRPPPQKKRTKGRRSPPSSRCTAIRRRSARRRRFSSQQRRERWNLTR